LYDSEINGQQAEDMFVRYLLDLWN